MTGKRDFSPVRIMQVEIDRPLPSIPTRDALTGREYHRALVLVRLHKHPLGVVELNWPEDQMTPQDCAAEIWCVLGPAINAHLRADHLPETRMLTAEGFGAERNPPCLQARARLLETAPFMSIVIPTRDRPEFLRRCLGSLLALEYPNYEVIVVDNAPRTPATAELVASTDSGKVPLRYVHEDRPGVSWARNRGLVAANGEFVAFTDDDVLVDRDWLTALAAAFRVADNVACVTGLILPLELETPAQVWFEEYGGFTRGFARRIYDMAEHRPGRADLNSRLYPYSAGIFGVGANNAFRAATFRALKGYDPALGGGSPALGGEELAEYFKTITRGYRLVYEPTAIVYHAHRRDYDALRRQIYSYGLGFSAYITKSVWDNPRLILDLISKVPYGLYRILDPRAPKHQLKRPDFPPELTRLELLGMLNGPLAYVRGRWQARQVIRRFGPLPVQANPSPTERAG